MSPRSPRPAAPSGHGSPLGWLGHHIAHHPWRALATWMVIALVCLVPAASVGSVITGTFSNPLPSSDESVRAENSYTTEFPASQGSPSSAIVLLEAPDITGAVGKNATITVTQRLAQDPHLHNISSISSLYTSYVGYLTGEAELAWGFLGGALSATPSLTVVDEGSASAVWGPEATYLDNWTSLVANLSAGTSPSSADYPAFERSQAYLASDPLAIAVLSTFYNGEGGAQEGFNASIFGGCLTSQSAAACADEAAQRTLPTLLPTLFTSPESLAPAELALGDLSLLNWTLALSQEAIGATVLGEEVGLSPAWLLTVWREAGGNTAPPVAQIGAWAEALVAEESVAAWPLPVPAELYDSFVAPSGSATIILVAFNVADSALRNGSSITYADVSEIDQVVPQALSSSPSFSTVRAYETGEAPLDDATNYLATSSLSLLLVLTILVLLIIMLLYFRSPSAPALAFGMIGIALVASLAAIFVVGTYVMTFNSEIESIILVFLMSIGTDYSVFLLARYREELVRGAPSKEAVATTVRWAGQSISTSGMAVMVVAAALGLSGISFLTQLGICLLIAVFFALLVNLTVLPSILVLVGPRIFWPNSGARFQRYAERRKHNIEHHRDYIARAGRAATQRPGLVIVLVLLLSAPVVVVALEVPVSYDITNIGLPASNSAQQGYTELTQDFGASYSSSSFALVTFSSPVKGTSAPNPQDLRDINALAETMSSTPGVRSVGALVGAGGTPLSTWLNFSSLPAATKITLNLSLALYVGADGTTVLFNVQTNASGYSASAISVIEEVQDRAESYASGHPEVQQVLVGGAAPTTKDIQSLVNQATEEMLVGAALGLFVLMLLILGSAFVPILALSVIGLSILWSWAGTYFVVGILEHEALIFLLPLILLILVLGLGMDYNVLLLTRVEEERSRGNRGAEAIRDAVTHAGGVITAAAVILGGAFLLLGFTSPLGLLAAIGLGIGFAVLLQAFVVQLFLTPAVLTVGKDRIWAGWHRSSGRNAREGAGPTEEEGEGA